MYRRTAGPETCRRDQVPTHLFSYSGLRYSKQRGMVSNVLNDGATFFLASCQGCASCAASTSGCSGPFMTNCTCCCPAAVLLCPAVPCCSLLCLSLLHCSVVCHTGGLGELKYPLVSDLKKEISDAYGVLTGAWQAAVMPFPCVFEASAVLQNVSSM